VWYAGTSGSRTCGIQKPDGSRLSFRRKHAGSWHLWQRGQSIWEKWVDGPRLMFGHRATPTQAGALPNSLSPETAKGAHGDNLILARWHGFSWSNSLVFENKGGVPGPTACVALPSQVPGGSPRSAGRNKAAGWKTGGLPSLGLRALRSRAKRGHCDALPSVAMTMTDHACLAVALRRARMPVAVWSDNDQSDDQMLARPATM